MSEQLRAVREYADVSAATFRSEIVASGEPRRTR